MSSQVGDLKLVFIEAAGRHRLTMLPLTLSIKANEIGAASTDIVHGLSHICSKRIERFFTQRNVSRRNSSSSYMRAMRGKV